MEHGIESGRLTLSTEAREGVEHGEIQFIAVGTPPDEDGSADMQWVLATAKALENLEKAAELAPNFIDIQINCAHALVASNNKCKAKAVLSNMLSQASSDDQRQRIKKELDKT